MHPLAPILEEDSSDNERPVDSSKSTEQPNQKSGAPTYLSTLPPPVSLYTPFPSLAVANFLTDDDGISILDDDHVNAAAVPPAPPSNPPSHSLLGQNPGPVANESTSSLATVASRIFRGPTRLLRGSSASLDSVADFLTLEPGQKTLQLSEFCNLIAKCASLERATIVSVECYKQWSRYGIMHRTLIFHLCREGRSDVWLRVDRLRSHGVSAIEFLRRGAKTEANDVAHLAGTKANLLRSPTAQPENRIEFGSPANLGVFRFCLQIICEELLEYHAWPSNCWFMCSLLQEHLFETGQGSFTRGGHIHLALAPAIRTQVRNRVWHVVSPSSLSMNSRTETDMSTPSHDLTSRWTTLDGGLDGRDFDGPALNKYLDDLADTLRPYLRILPDDSPCDDVPTSILELARQAISLEFILLQQHPTLVLSRKEHFLVAHPTRLFPDRSSPLLLSFLEFLRYRNQTDSEEPWRITLRGLISASRIVAASYPAIFRAYATAARTLIATHSDGGRYWTNGQVVKGFTSYVTYVAFSPSGKQIASSSHDETIRLWDPLTGDSIGPPMRGHKISVWTVAFSPDGTQIASGSFDCTLRRWSASSGQSIGPPMRGHTKWVLCVTYSPDGKFIVSGSGDHTIRRWDASTGEEVGKPLEGHTNLVQSVAFSADGKRIVSGSIDLTIRVWDAISGEMVGEPLKGHTDNVYSVAFSPDGRFIFSGAWDNTVRRWDALTGESIGAPMLGHSDKVNCISISPDGRQIASASDDRTIRIWDTTSGKPLGEPLTGHTGILTSVAFSPDGRQIASGSGDHTVRIWDYLGDLDDWTRSD